MLPSLFCSKEKREIKKAETGLELRGMQVLAFINSYTKKLIFSSNPLTLPCRVRIGEEAQILMPLRKVAAGDSDSVVGVGYARVVYDF